MKRMTADQYILLVSKCLGLPADELKALFKNPKTPALDLAVISAITGAIKKQDPTKLEVLLQRVIGKVKDVVEIQGDLDPTPQKINLSKLTKKQLLEYRKILKAGAPDEEGK